MMPLVNEYGPATVWDAALEVMDWPPTWGYTETDLAKLTAQLTCSLLT